MSTPPRPTAGAAVLLVKQTKVWESFARSFENLRSANKRFLMIATSFLASFHQLAASNAFLARFWRPSLMKWHWIYFFFFLKVLTIVCMVMHYNSMIETTDQHSILIINGTFVGFTIILIALFAGYLMSTPINKRIGKIFSNWIFISNQAHGCVSV